MITALIVALTLMFGGAGHPMLPDANLTPGKANPAVTQKTVGRTICRDGWTKTVRNVSESEKKQVMKRYGLPLSELPKVEIDHFISLELGGTSDVANLWPQYYDPAPGQVGYLGARQKDVVETWLHRQVCANEMTIDEAQSKIRIWPGLYVALSPRHAK